MNFGPSLDFLEFADGSIYAIHGLDKDVRTGRLEYDPGLIGKKRLTDGCIMLRDSDMQKVYQWAPIGTRIEIHAS